MWWLIPIAIGAAGAIYAAISGEEKDAARRWERDRARVERSIEEHRANIERHLEEAKESYNFQFLKDVHHSSFRIADEAHKLQRDAESAVATTTRILDAAREKRAEFERVLQTHIPIERRREVLKEVELLVQLRAEVLPTFHTLRAQRNTFVAETRRLNAQTRAIKEAIRDRCGVRGREWYDNLEARNMARRAAG